MKIVPTRHALGKFLERELAEQVKESVIVPRKIVREFQLSKYSEQEIIRRSYLYTYHPETHHFFVLQVDRRKGEIRVITVFRPEDIRRENLTEMASGWRKLSDVYPFCLVP